MKKKMKKMKKKKKKKKHTGFIISRLVGIVIARCSRAPLAPLVHTKDEEKGKELHVGLAYAYARAIETKDPSVIEDRWPDHRYLRTGEVALLRGKRGKSDSKGKKKKKARTEG